MMELSSDHPMPNRTGRPVPAQAMVEFSLAVLLLVGVMLAIIEGARWMSTYFMLSNAASEGARVGALLASTDSQIREATQFSLAPWIFIDPNTDVAICRLATASASDTTCPNAAAASGNFIQVKVTYSFQWSLFPIWIGQMADQTITVSDRQRID